MKNQKGFAHILRLLVMVFAVGISGWWWKNNKLNLAVRNPSHSISNNSQVLISCNDIDIYKSDNLKLKIRCPENLFLFECERDINLFDLDNINYYDQFTSKEALCKERQGAIQILMDTKPLYNSYPKSNSNFEVQEENITINDIPAIRQKLEYTGANIPPYSEFVTFSKNGDHYQIKILSKELVPEFNQILSTFEFVVAINEELSTESWEVFDPLGLNLWVSTTDDWNSYHYREKSNIKFTLKYPSGWQKATGFAGFQLNDNKILEFSPGIVDLQPGQKCFDFNLDEYEDSSGGRIKIISKENIYTQNYEGSRMIQKVAASPSGRIWYPNMYCLQNDFHALVITFYESELDSERRKMFDSVVSTFEFIQNE